jgi:hypothetical protein
MDISRLKKKRQLNVQEQNALTENHIIETVKRFENEEQSFAWLRQLLHEKKLEASNGILVAFSVTPDQAGNVCYGIWLTSDERFIDFEVEIARGSQRILSVDRWEEKTKETTVSLHQRGTGKSFGFLALDVLHQLRRVG